MVARLIRPTMVEINYWTNGKICAKAAFPVIRKVLNLCLKAEKQLQNENHTEDWALGSHPRDNGHVTHYTEDPKS